MSDLKNEALSEEIAKTLLSGTITEAEQGTLVKQIQVAMGSQLLKSLTSITSQYKQLEDSISQVLQHLIPSIETLPPDTPASKLLEIYDTLTSIQLRSVELTRKVAQGKPLFDFPILSDDEKMVATLLSSFSSQEEKREFLSLVKEWMANRKPMKDE